MSKRLEYKFHREWLVDILKWAEGWQSKNWATDKPRAYEPLACESAV